MKWSFSVFRRAVFFLLPILAGGSSLSGADYTWVGPVGGDWFQSTNWSGNTLPTSSDDAIIADGSFALINTGTAQANGLILGKDGLTGGVTVEGLGRISTKYMQLSSNGGAMVNILSGGQAIADVYIDIGHNETSEVTISGAGSLLQAKGSTLENTLGGFGSVNYTVTDGGMASYAAGVVAASQALSDVQININGTDGARGVFEARYIKRGAGTASITLDGGVLRARESTSDFLVNFQDGDVTFAAGGGTIDTNGHNIGISTVLGGAGGLTARGAGVLTLTATNTYLGGTTINEGGTIAITDENQLGAASGALTFDDGTLRLDGPLTIDRDIVIENGGGTIDTATVNFHTIAGTIAGTGPLTKTGQGALTLSGANSSFSGLVHVRESSLIVTNDDALGLGEVTLWEGSNLAVGDGVTVSNAINIDGAADIGNYGVNSQATFSGAISLNNSFLSIMAGANAASSVTVQGGVTGVGDVTLKAEDGATLLVETGTLNQVGELDNSGSGSGATTVNAVIGANVTAVTQRSATSQFNLGGVNAYLGQTTVQAGTLALVGAGSIATSSGVSVASGGTFDITGITPDATTIQSLSGSGTVNVGTKSLTFGGTGDSIFSGAILGTRPPDLASLPSLIKQGTGTMTLSGTSTYTGGLRVENGTVIIASNGALGNSYYSSAATATGTNSKLLINSGISLTKGISVNFGATLENKGTINSQYGVMSLGGATFLNTGTISSSFADGLYVQDGVGVITNTGGSISGQGGNGAWLRAGGSFKNESGGTVSGANNFDGIWIEGGAGTVENLTGSTITGRYNGITLVDGGTITNSGGSTIQTTGGGGMYGIQGSDAAVTVNNLDTSVISGRLRGVWLDSGGSVTNEGTISKTASTGSNIAGVRFSSAAATLTNKGTINGGVLMSDHAHTANLFAGSKIDGALNMGTSTSAALNLDGTGEQLLSDAVTGAVTFRGALAKLGLGSWTLDKSLSSVASTNIQSGTLRVNTTLGGTATVRTGATLSGTGSIAGTVTVEDGATVAAGNSPGVLTLGGLTLNNTSQLAFELGSPTSDRIDVSGLLTMDGVLNISALAGFDAGTYRLFNYGSLVNNGLTFGNAPMPFEYAVNTDVNGQVNLIVTAAEWQYWDGSQTTANNTVDGGTGTWDTTTTNWTTSTGYVNGNWVNGTVGAVFKGASGTVTIANGATISAPALSFQIDGYVLTANGTGNLQLTDDGVIEVYTGAAATISAPITDGKLTKTQGGKLVLSGDNSYADGTTILAGTIAARHDSALGTGAVSIANGAALSVETSQLLIGALSGDAGSEILLDGGNALGISVASGSSVFAGDITGTTYGMLVKLGAGTQVLSGSNTFKGQVNVFAGTLSFASDTALSANAYLGVDAGALARMDNVDLTIAQLLGATGEVEIAGGSLTLGGQNAVNTYGGIITGTGGLIMDGGSASIQTLTGANTYSGGTTVRSGKLALSDGGSLFASSALTVESAGTFDISALTAGGTTISALAGEGAVLLGAKSLVFGSAADSTFSGVISGLGGSITKQDTGKVTLSGANTYSGGTTINAGTLQTNHASALGAGGVTLNAGATLEAIAPLTLQSMNWNGGTVALNISSPISITEGLTMTLDGTFSVSSAAANTKYTLMTFDTALSTLKDFSVNALSGLAGTISVIEDVLTGYTSVLLEYIGSSSGGELSNYAPIFTPTTADFLVSGDVNTSDAANTVNSLTFDPASTLNVFNQLTITTGSFLVTSGSAQINGTGTVIAPSDFLKTGIGTLVANTPVIVGGTTQIKQGALFINNLFQTPGGLNIFNGGSLGGSGFIFGNVVNNGTVAPGNSPGTLTINGNFTQTASGTLEIEVAGGSVFDRLVVNGQANLGGTLAVQSFGGYEFEYGGQFAFLFANEINGEFDSITVPDFAKFRGRFIESDGTGTLVLAPSRYEFVAETPNQTNVARALNSYIGGAGDRDMVSAALDLQTAEQYPAAFDAIAPTYYESLANISLEQITAQNQFIAQRLSAVRLGARGFSAQGIEQPLLHDRDGKSVFEAKSAKSLVETIRSTNWNLWVQGNGIFAKMSLANLPSNRFNSGGFLGGADYRWSENFATGIYAGYQGTFSKFADGSSTTIQSTLFGLYGTFDHEGFYINGILGGAYNNYGNRRAIDFSTIERTARSEVNGGQFTAYLDAGYDWQVGNFTFGPILSGQYTYTGLSGFTETGADSLDLAVGQQNANSIRTNLGGRIAYTWQVSSNVTVIPEVRMFWQHEYLNGPRNIASALDGGAGPSFGYETAAPGRDSVFVGAGASANFGPNWNAYFYYNADFGRQDYVGQMISGGLNWKF